MVQQQTVSTEPLHISLQDVVARHGEPPWSEQLLSDGRNNAGLICNAPGTSNDAHIHTDFNEWWIVLRGEIVWEVGDHPAIYAKKGDVVISPAGTRHMISTVGDEPSLRLYINKPGSSHSIKGPRANDAIPFPDQTLPPNLVHSRLDQLMAHFGEPPWSTTLLDDDRNKANLICHGPGMSNNAHWHPDFDEWWTILAGELTWEVGEGRPMIHARDGDIVFVPRGMRHHITTVGSEISLRLPVTTPESLHIYSDDDKAAPPPRA